MDQSGSMIAMASRGNTVNVVDVGTGKAIINSSIPDTGIKYY